MWLQDGLQMGVNHLKYTQIGTTFGYPESKYLLFYFKWNILNIFRFSVGFLGHPVK